MSNFRKTSDLSPPIRLPKQSALPTPHDIREMQMECKRSRKRVELPWLPAGKDDPCILTVNYDGQVNWMLYSGTKADSTVVWTGLDPSADAVISALRDWLAAESVKDGWAKDNPELQGLLAKRSEPEKPAPATAPSVPAEPQTVPPPPPTAAPPDPSYAQQPYGAPPQQYPPGYGQPYPQYQNPTYPAGYPQMPGYQQYPPQPAYGYPGYLPYPTAPVPPPHWTQYPQPAPPVAPPTPPTQNVVPPEQWALMHEPHRAAAAPAAEVQSVPMLGDLLVASGVIPSRTLQAALTLQNASLVEPRRIGEILVKSGALKKHILSAAISLQELARKGIIPKSKVTDLLRQVCSSGMSIDELLGPAAAAIDYDPHVSPVGSNTGIDSRVHSRSQNATGNAVSGRNDRVSDVDRDKLKSVLDLLKRTNFGPTEGNNRAAQIIELLRQSTVVSPDTLQEAKKNNDNQGDIIRWLLVKECVDPMTLEAAIGCQRLVALERLKMEQAVIALNYCQRMRVTLKDAIVDLNWLVPTDDI